MRQQCLHQNPPSGLTLPEVVISTLLVGVLLVGAMKSFGAVLRSRDYTAEADRRAALAQDLLSEILETAYSDPDETPVFGCESSESSGTRTDWDDVDDYHNWDASPPEEKDGTQLSALTNLRRTVSVEYVDPNNLSVTVGSDQNVKRITVNVYDNGQLVTSETAVRTSAWKVEE